MANFKAWLEEQESLEEGLSDIALGTGRVALGAGKLALKGLGKAAYAVTHPVETGKGILNTILGTYRTLKRAYGTPAALAIMAGCVGLHVAFPAFAAFPGSIGIGTAPGVIIGDMVQFLRGKETLIAQGVEFLKKNMTKEQIAKLFQQTRAELEQAANDQSGFHSSNKLRPLDSNQQPPD